MDIMKVKYIPKHKCDLWALNNLDIEERKGHQCDTCSYPFESFPGNQTRAVICLHCKKAICNSCTTNHAREKRYQIQSTYSQSSRYSHNKYPTFDTNTKP